MKRGTQMFTEEFDFNFELGLGEFLETLEKYRAQVVKFVAVGPGGGNPAITLGFEAIEDLEAFREFMDI
jgi:hypothetical protein